MKTVFIGDIHGDSVWYNIVESENADRVVFVGDYFDSFDIPCEQQVRNFLDIMKWKENNPQIEVVCLIGNHDYHYYKYIGNLNTSGYQIKNKFLLENTISAYSENLQMAYQFDNILVTHAGVSEDFMNNNFENWDSNNIADLLNDLFHYRPLQFRFNSIESYFCDNTGDDIHQSPIWIRPKSLMKANKNSIIKKDLIQIVGHTPVNKIDMGKSTGGRYYFIDTLRLSNEYLLLEDKKFSKKICQVDLIV